MIPPQPNMFVKFFVVFVISFCIVGIQSQYQAQTKATHDKVHISPGYAELVRFVNDSHIVTCHGHKGTKVRWLGPRGELVTETKGRYHVEPRPSIAPGALALIFEHISLTDRGNWTCTSDTNDFKKIFKLVVNEPISFMDTPKIQSAKEDKDAIIKCDVRGDPEPMVTWQMNGQQIILPNPRYAKLADGLLIRNVSLADRGEYTCKAYQLSTAISSVLEKAITLNIQHKPMSQSRTHARSEQAYGFISGVVNLTCEAVAEPAANFTWQRGKKTIKSEPYIVFTSEHQSVLQVPITSDKAFGDYTCKATNALGSLVRVINLQEGIKPDPPNKVFLRGANSDTLDIEVVGTPVRNSAQQTVSNGMLPIGYRFQFTPIADFTAKDGQEQRNGQGSWDKARQMDFGIEDGATYLLTGLNHDTVYLVRVASRNVAGLSDFAAHQEYKTSRVQPHSVTSAASTPSLPTSVPDLLCILYLTVSFIQISI